MTDNALRELMSFMTMDFPYQYNPVTDTFDLVPSVADKHPPLALSVFERAMVATQNMRGLYKDGSPMTEEDLKAFKETPYYPFWKKNARLY